MKTFKIFKCRECGTPLPYVNDVNKKKLNENKRQICMECEVKRRKEETIKFQLDDGYPRY